MQDFLKWTMKEKDNTLNPNKALQI